MNTIIKELTIDDFDQIIRIWDLAGLPYKPNGREQREIFAQEMALDHVAMYGLYADNIMLGVGIANWDGRRGWVNRVAIHPDHRGHGYAGTIIKKCIEFLESKGALAIAALIEDVNAPSITAFQKEGFKVLPEILYLSRYKYDGA